MNQRTSRSRVRYAVVGLGHIAQVAVLPAFENARNSELLALVSDDPEKLGTLGKKYKLEHLYSYNDFSRALSNVDAVFITLPNHLHREYAVRAAAAGVHVLCEKPMAPTAEDCLAMINASEQNYTKLMIAYRLHFEAGNLEAIKLANSGRIGNPRFFTSEFAQQVIESNVRVKEPVTHGGGPLYDMGVYCINAARYLFRSEPVEVTALAESKKGDTRFTQTEEMVSVAMRFPGERLATFTSSFGGHDVSRYTLTGSKGALRVDPAYQYAEGIKLETTIAEKRKTRVFGKRDQFAAELTYFSDCILKNRDPEPDGFEGLADVRIIEAIYESIRTRRTVPVRGVPVRKGPSDRQDIHRPAHGKPGVIHAGPPSRQVA
ncbi:MAG TPA: Gfo/Idh/MocA family oxidoreductase [Candidatus Sulfotelmatobacter sp.]|nr:Gfo/Idh/MocA family oxidoreductase [Candidatus Sulfotelmatobacter sp.]